MARTLTLLLALLGCACSSLSRTRALDEPIPGPSERTAVGAWQLGDDNCVGSIQAAEGTHFWVTDCAMKFGYGWCEFGLRLEKQGPRVFVNRKKDWRFTINEDGTLTESRGGEQQGPYAKSPTGVCGVRIRTAA